MDDGNDPGHRSDKSNRATSGAKTKVFKPKAVILDFNGTIVPNRWDDDVLPPYVKENLLEFLKRSVKDPDLREAIDELRRVSLDRRFKFKYLDCPFIPDEDEAANMIPGKSQKSAKTHTQEEAPKVMTADAKNLLAKRVNDYMIWEMERCMESPANWTIQRYVWMDGLSKRLITVPIFEDVLTTIKRWRAEEAIKIFLIEVISEELLKLFLSNTSEGDLTGLFDGIYGKPRINSKIEADSYMKISKYAAIPKTDLLFITDYGQEARAATSANVDAILVERKGNRHLREYYRLTYTVVNSLDQIQFLQKPSGETNNKS